MLASLRANLLATALGILSAILFAVCAYQFVQLHGFLWIDGANDKLEDCARDRNELRSISTKRNEQRETTDRNIRQSQKYIQIRDREAERIEKAPLPGNCRTPSEVLGADL